MSARFKRVAQGLDVAPLVVALARQPALWQFDRYWKDHPVPVFREVDTIYLRMVARAPYSFRSQAEKDEAMRTLDPWEASDEPCLGNLPEAAALMFDVMAMVRGERLGRVLINSMPPGSHIPGHSDIAPELKYYERFHIPLQTNTGLTFRAGDEVQKMEVGELWWFDNTAVHEVWNRGDCDRIHLIIDIRAKGFS
jgi:hypothetical protein